MTVNLYLMTRCTLGYAFAIALLVHRDGWTACAQLSAEQLALRIAAMHGHGMSGGWS